MNLGRFKSIHPKLLSQVGGASLRGSKNQGLTPRLGFQQVLQQLTALVSIHLVDALVDGCDGRVLFIDAHHRGFVENTGTHVENLLRKGC